MMGDETSSKIISHLTQLEEYGDRVIKGKRASIDLDSMRNNNRVSLRELSHKSLDEKCWISIGNSLVQLNVAHAKQFLEDEQKKVEISIDENRKSMKLNVNKLRDLEGKPPLVGMDLKPLNHDELKVIYETYRK